MIVYDHPRVVTFRGKVRRTAHMASTLVGAAAREELDTFAVRIGLKTEWRQNSDKPTEHYDLFDGAIERAYTEGGVCVPVRELVRMCVEPKREAQRGEA